MFHWENPAARQDVLGFLRPNKTTVAFGYVGDAGHVFAGAELFHRMKGQPYTQATLAICRMRVSAARWDETAG